MKNLICAKDIEALKEEGRSTCLIDSNTIITPSARDTADSLGITFSIEDPRSRSDWGMKNGEDGGNGIGISENQIYLVLKMLMEKGFLEGIFKPYEGECHSNGLKVVRGNTVKMDVFDTGKPGTNAFYQELVGKKESHISAGFLVIDHSDFEWELTYEEIDYVIEGTLTVTIDQKTYTAHAGDVLFVPSGSKVIWGSPDKARVFYATYPADWADAVTVQGI